MPKSSIVVLNIHQVADIERKRLNSKDRHHSSSHTHTNNKDCDAVSFVSLEQQDEEEMTSGEEETKASTSSTSQHDEDSYTSSYKHNKKNPTTYQPRPRRDSCTLSQCERGQDHDDDDISLEGPASDRDHDSLFSESQNSSAVFSFVSDDELCQQGSVGGYDSNCSQSGMNSTRIGEDTQDELHVSSHAKDEDGIKRKLILSFYGLLGALHRGACNVYSACWTIVKRKSWSMFAILYEG